MDRIDRIHSPLDSQNWQSAGTRLGLLIACMFLAGCSKPEFERFPLEGNIRFAGEPVTSGFIVFEPDTAKGNRGPQGYASIVHGRYETDSTGKGPVAGPIKVRIVGLKAGGAASEDRGISLFEPYETSIDVSAATSAIDFEVPLSQKPRSR
jgi:hypothetical protein